MFCQKVIHSKSISRKQISRCHSPIRPILFILHVFKMFFALMWVKKHELPISRDNLLNSNGNDILSFFQNFKCKCRSSHLLHNLHLKSSIDAITPFRWDKEWKQAVNRDVNHLLAVCGISWCVWVCVCKMWVRINWGSNKLNREL